MILVVTALAVVGLAEYMDFLRYGREMEFDICGREQDVDCLFPADIVQPGGAAKQLLVCYACSGPGPTEECQHCGCRFCRRCLVKEGTCFLCHFRTGSMDPQLLVEGEQLLKDLPKHFKTELGSRPGVLSVALACAVGGEVQPSTTCTTADGEGAAGNVPFQEPGRDGREAGRPLTRDDGVPSERQRRGWHRDLTEEGIEPQPGPSRRAGWRQRILGEAMLDLCIIILSGFAWVGDYLAGLAVQLLPAPPRAVDSEAEEEAERQAAQLEDFERR